MKRVLVVAMMLFALPAYAGEDCSVPGNPYAYRAECSENAAVKFESPTKEQSALAQCLSYCNNFVERFEATDEGFRCLCIRKEAPHGDL